MSFDVSFMTAERHDASVAGSSHASSVIALVRSSEGESATVTHALVPLNESALPYLPAAAHVAFAIVPLFAWPEVSLTVEPTPSSNAYAATRPATWVVFDTVTPTPGDVVLFPAASA